MRDAIRSTSTSALGFGMEVILRAVGMFYDLLLFKIGSSFLVATNCDRVRKLDRAAGRADEVAEDGNVGAVDTDAAGIHGKAEQFGLFEIHASVIKLGEAKSLGRQHAI